MDFWVGQDDFDLRGVSEKSELIHRAEAFCESIGSKNFSYMLLNPPRNALLKTDPVITNCPTESACPLYRARLPVSRPSRENLQPVPSAVSLGAPGILKSVE